MQCGWVVFTNCDRKILTSGQKLTNQDAWPDFVAITVSESGLVAVNLYQFRSYGF